MINENYETYVFMYGDSVSAYLVSKEWKEQNKDYLSEFGEDNLHGNKEHRDGTPYSLDNELYRESMRSPMSVIHLEIDELYNLE